MQHKTNILTRQFEVDMSAKCSAKSGVSVATEGCAAEESDEEVRELQQHCYDALLAEVKAIAEQKGVNYVNIINMVALRYSDQQN